MKEQWTHFFFPLHALLVCPLADCYIYLETSVGEERDDVCPARGQPRRDFARPRLLLCGLHEFVSESHALVVRVDRDHPDLKHTVLGQAENATVNLEMKRIILYQA